MNNDLYILKNCNTRYHRNNSIFLKHVARDILKNKRYKFKGINDCTFTDIINRIFELKVAQLYSNGYINLGHGLGKITISLRKRPNDIRKYVVDWNETLKLWLRNDNAKQNKKVVRVLNYDKYVKYTWSNRSKGYNLHYYDFLPLRTLRKQLYFDVINNKNIMFYE